MADPYVENLSAMIKRLELSVDKIGQLECRHFFSGAALYANGKICASLTPVGFGLKLPAEVRMQLIETIDGTELRYFENSPVKKDYVALSKRVLQDDEWLRSLLLNSIEFVTGERFR